jgi:4-hydroxybenzoate polyprenyltransferase
MFKIVRPINLLISALSLVLMQFVFIYPLLEKFQVKQLFKPWQFFILLVASIAVQASGYIINDYFDVNIDEVNKPNKLIVGKRLSPKKTMRYYILMSVIAIFMGIWVSFSVYKFNFILLFLLPMGLLWFYSQSYKRMFAIGNIVVAFCAGLFASLVGVFNFSAYTDELIKTNAQVFYIIFIFTLINAFYAFFSNLVREIIKDCEDIEGDNEYGCNTIPIKLGIEKTKIILIILNLILITFSSYFIYKTYFYNYNTIVLWLIIYIILLIIQILQTLKANNKASFKWLSDWSKITMIWGIFLPVFVNLSI